MTALTAVAKVVTPSVVATVVPTALMHQNSAIATPATVCANSFPGESRFIVVGNHRLQSGHSIAGVRVCGPGLLLGCREGGPGPRTAE